MRRLALATTVGLLAFTAPAFAAFPGENGDIAISSARTPGELDIAVVDLDGTVSTVVQTPIRDESSPAWSPDGRHIVYSRYMGGPNSDLFLAERDGSNERRLTTTGYMDESPSWSPDGRRIVYTADPTTNCVRDTDCEADLWILDVETLESAMLTDRGFQPAWSPLGDKIAFTRISPDSPCCEGDVHTIAPDGTGVTNLTPNTPRSDVSPTWSPDGTHIAYASEAASCCVPNEIFRMAADGSGKTRLTFSGGSTGFIIADSPTWSPDGARIAFIWRPVGGCGVFSCGWEVFHMATDGSDVTRLTQDNVLDQDPDWGPLPNRPPDCTALAANPPSLWPPNRRFSRVEITGASDPDGGPLSVEVTGVTQDEPITAKGDTTTPDAQRFREATVLLRAERNPRGNGRVYRVSVRVSDDRGGTCEGTAAVEVRRHRHRPAIDSAPPLFDSFGP